MSKSNKARGKEERKVFKSNLIEIKTEKSLGLDITSRNFTLILSNVQSIKNKQDIITELLDDSNADLAVLTETWLTDVDEIWVQGSELHRCNYRIDDCHRKDKKGRRFSTGDQAKPQGEERRWQNNSGNGVCQVESNIGELFP